MHFLGDGCMEDFTTERNFDLQAKAAFSLPTGHTWDPQKLAECLGSGCSGSFLGQNCKTTLILKTVLDVSQT